MAARWLPFKDAAKLKPFVIKEKEYNSAHARSLMVANQIESIPIVDEKGCPITIVSWFEILKAGFPSSRR